MAYHVMGQLFDSGALLCWHEMGGGGGGGGMRYQQDSSACLHWLISDTQWYGNTIH